MDRWTGGRVDLPTEMHCCIKKQWKRKRHTGNVHYFVCVHYDMCMCQRVQKQGFFGISKAGFRMELQICNSNFSHCTKSIFTQLFLQNLQMLPAEGSQYRRKLRKVLFNSGWIASEIGMVAKSAIAVSRDFAHRTRQTNPVKIKLAKTESHPKGKEPN